MRKKIDEQMQIGEIDISQVEIDLTSRDEIPKLLRGLQYIYTQQELRESIFGILEKLIPENISTTKGRKGMNYWRILVLGTLRLICNWDYDKLKDAADNHATIRLMMALSPVLDREYKFGLQTIKDNISLFTPEILKLINREVVISGQKLSNKTDDKKISARCDSFVVETDVHFPTDINLLFDSVRKVIELLSRCCDLVGISDWRQSPHNVRQVKKLYRRAQKLKHSTSKDPKKQKEKEEVLKEAYTAYLDLASSFLNKAEATLPKIKVMGDLFEKMTLEISKYIAHGRRQIDQTKRRVISGEKIPHHEKVFSIFEEHTEWICKGKAGVPQELGLRVCIVEDQNGFVINYQVMTKMTDDQVAVPLITETKTIYPELNQCSFDKGFYTPENLKKLEQILDKVILPKKGKLSGERKEVETSEAFVEARHKHSAVESGINALEKHGLDVCPDKGIKGFERYVGLAVLAHNIHRLGTILQKMEIKRQKRKRKYRKTVGNKSQCAVIAA